jgi:F0F1-type ATP synthase membrane subunit c/vacuolar-type H+-ATPase subunit K
VLKYCKLNKIKLKNMDIETTKLAVEAVSTASENAVIAKAIIIGFGVMGPSISLGMIFSKGLEGISRNPQAAGKITP